MFQENSKLTWLELAQKVNLPLRPRDGRIGLEIELEGENLPQGNQGKEWVVHAEGSLRNGVEYVSRYPVVMGKLQQHSQKLKEQLVYYNAKPVMSHRGSTHIHYNVQKVKAEDVLGMIILFTLVEAVFLRLCGRQRDGNLFCLPSYDCGGFEKNFEDLCVYVRDMLFPDQRGKYAALNTDPLFALGSLEFRCFPPSLDPGDHVKWAAWIDNIRKYTEAAKDKTMSEEIRGSYNEPDDILRAVFGDLQQNVYPFLGPTRARDLVALGCSQAYELSRVYRKFLNKSEKAKPIPGPVVVPGLANAEIYDFNENDPIPAEAAIDEDFEAFDDGEAEI